MLKLNDERNILEGGLKLSDCERDLADQVKLVSL